MSKQPSNKIAPAPMPKEIGVVDLIDTTYRLQLPRLREICHCLVEKCYRRRDGGSQPCHDASWLGFRPGTTDPNGFIDWMISTGANLP